LQVGFTTNERILPILLIAFVGMILITSQQPAFAGFVDGDDDGFQNIGYCDHDERPTCDPDDDDPCDPDTNTQSCKDALKIIEKIQNLVDDITDNILDLVDNNKDAQKLIKKIDKIIKALDPPDTTEKNINKLLKDTNKLLEKEKITTDEHNALVTVIPTGDEENINAVLAGIILSDKDLKKLTKTIGKLNDVPVPNVAKACKELGGFNKEVNKLFDNGLLTETEKDTLIGAAEAIKTAIGCA